MVGGGFGFSMGFRGAFMWLIWLLPAVALAWVLKSVFAGQKNLTHKAITALDILEEKIRPCRDRSGRVQTKESEFGWLTRRNNL